MSSDDSAMDGVYWRAFAAAAPGVVLVVDIDGTVLQGAPKQGALKVVGHKIWHFGTGDAQRRIRQKLEAVVKTREALVYVNGGTRLDGGEGWFEVCVIPVEREGRIDRVLWIATDITDGMSSRHSLEASERRARALIEHGRDCITVVDSSGRITYASPGLLAALGYSPADILGELSLAFIHPDDRPTAFSAGRGSSVGAVTEATVRVRHKDGSYRLFEGTSQNLLDDPAVRAIINNHRDITARHALEEQLRQSQKMEAVGLLAGGVAHDFNNLLAIIMGWSGLAARRLPPDHPVQHHLLEVEEAARRGSELTRKLLTFSRKQIMKPAVFDVRAAVDDFTQMIQRILGEDVDLEVERAPDPLFVRADPAQLEQVLMNLCANARQAMPAGGQMHICTRHMAFDAATTEERPWAREGAFAQITVSDTGIGMDETVKARVFEPFFTTKSDGTGLGLAMVYGIVEQHGGFMHVESAPGRGTSFTAYFPCTDERVVATSAAHRTRPEPAIGGHETVLLAEDEPSLRALVATTLSELGYLVTSTRDGEEAAREYERRQGAFDLVVLDVVMPRLGAREAYERMRAVNADVRVLFTTGYAPASTHLREVLDGGAFPLLEKPFTPAALGAAVRDALDRGRASSNPS